MTVAALPVVFWLPVVFTPGRSMFSEPSKDTPPIVRAVARAVAVAALPVVSAALLGIEALTKEMFSEPSKDTPPMVRAVARAVAVAALPVVSWLPVASTPGSVMLPVPSKETPPILRALSRAVAVAALPVQEPEEPEALPVTLPVSGPANPVAVSTPVLALYVSSSSVLGGWLPVAPSNSATEQDVFSVSAAVTAVGAATTASTYVLIAPWVASRVAEPVPTSPLSIPVTVAPVASARLVDAVTTVPVRAATWRLSVVACAFGRPPSDLIKKVAI